MCLDISSSLSLSPSTIQSSTSPSLLRPFLLGLRGRELKRRRVFCVRLCSRMWLKCWLLIPECQLREDDMRCCSAKTSKFVYHLPLPGYETKEMNYYVFFLAVSSIVHIRFYHDAVFQSMLTISSDLSIIVLQNLKVIWGTFFSLRCLLAAKFKSQERILRYCLLINIFHVVDL